MAGSAALARCEWAKSLRFKATVGFVAFLSLVGAGLSTLFLATWETQERVVARRAALQTSASLAEAVAGDLAHGNLERARLSLELRLKHDPSLLLAVVAGRSGEVIRLGDRRPDLVRGLVGAGPPPARGATRIATHESPDGPLLDVAVPLVGADADPDGGRLRLVFAPAPRAAQVAELRWRVAAITVAMLVLGAAGAMFIAGRILGPLPELVRGTRRIAEGDFEHRIRAETDDEIGALARAFNDLAGRLLGWQERQRSWSRELEERVAAKTRETAETREHLANVVEHVGASILVADLDGTVVSANTHTMHVFGTKPEFAVGRPLEEFAGDAGAKPEVLLPDLVARGTRTTETRLGTDRRPARDLLLVHTLLRDSGGRAAGILQITKDVTELKAMERRLVRSERLSAMGEMAGEIGHELNHYLMAIGGRAEMIVAALEAGTDPPQLAQVRRGAAIIAEQVAEMRRLTDGLLDAARKESSPADTDLPALVDRTIEFVRPQNRFDGVTLVAEHREAGLRVFADPQQLRQVVLNLLTNAAEAVRAHRRAGGTVRVTTLRDAGAAVLRVEDDGPGVDEAILDRIFEPHFTTKPEGHGFGLAVCHRVAANHGGSIQVDPAPAGGAIFTVRLPLRGGPIPGAGTSPGTERAPSSPPPSPGSASPSSRSGRP